MIKKQYKKQWKYIYPFLFMVVVVLVLLGIDKLNIYTKLITFCVTIIWISILAIKDIPQKLILTKKAAIYLGWMILLDSIYFFALGMQEGITFQYPSSTIPDLLEFFGLMGGLCFFYMLSKEMSLKNGS